jgi:hypothetical protein
MRICLEVLDVVHTFGRLCQERCQGELAFGQRLSQILLVQLEQIEGVELQVARVLVEVAAQAKAKAKSKRPAKTNASSGPAAQASAT